MADIKAIIATRVAKELQNGDVVNLGIGLPTLVANYLPEGVSIIIHSENGIMGMGPAPEKGKEDMDIVNAGSKCVTITPLAMFFDSAESFGVARGGHVDATVLGALEVDEKGNLANWIVPGKMVSGMGGAMDLVAGSKKVIVAMTHTTQTGAPKILKECSLPYTAIGVISRIVTEMAVIDVSPDGLVLKEIHPDFTLQQVQDATGAKLIISPDLKPML